MIRLCRALLFQLVFLLGTLLLLLVAVPVARFSDRLLRRMTRFWGGWFWFCARLLLGIRLRVRGEAPRQAIFAFKHQSYYEAILLLHLFPNPAVVMKEELRHLPLWGYLAARHGSMFVARDKGGSALRRLLRQAKAHAAEGRPIVLFPEGTRVAVGASPPLKPGLYAVYAGIGLPVIPVAHDAGRCWPKGLRKNPGTVTIRFMEPIPPGLPREELEKRVHAAINSDPVGDSGGPDTPGVSGKAS